MGCSDLRVRCRATILAARLTAPLITCSFILWFGTAGASEPAPADREPSKPSYTEADLFRFLEDEIEVTTASQLKTKITEVPQAVYVLTRDEIDRLAALNIADLLRHIPGLIVANTTHAQWTVGVEAPVVLGTGLVLILIDGRAVYSPLSGSTEWWPIPYTVDDIERVEVVMGPSTTIHGSQAVFGVVNFITRGAAEEGVHARVTGGGSYGADLEARFGDLLTHTSGTVHLGPVRLRAGAGYERLTPFDQPPIFDDGRRVPVPAAQRLFGNLRAEIDLGSDATVTLLAGAAGHEGPFIAWGPGVLVGADVHADTELTLRRLLTDGDQLSLRAYYRFIRYYTHAPIDPLLPGARTEMREHSGLARVLYTTPLPAHNRLVAALEVRLDHSSLDVVAAAGQSYQYLSVLVQDEFRPFEPLIFSGGLRLETQLRKGLSFFERLAVTPQLSTVWLPWAGHGLRLAYGQAMFYQGAFVEYGDVRAYDGVLQIYRGNPDTFNDPVHIWEVGYRGQISSSLLVTLSYTCRLIVGRIWATPGEESLLPFTVANIPSRETRHALDATASFRPWSILRLDAALTWLIAAEREQAYREYAGDAPDWRVSGRAHLAPNDRVNFDVEAHFLSSRVTRSLTSQEQTDIAGSFYLNVKLAYVFMDEPRLEVFGLANNLTSTQLGAGISAELGDYGVTRVGRRFLLGLGAEF